MMAGALMSNHRQLTAAIAVTLCVALSNVSSLTAATSDWQPTTQLAHHVVLGPGGLFQGNVVDRCGAPLAGSHVAMIENGQQVASVVTDAGGWFRIRGVPSGTYTLLVAGGRHAYRLWTRGSEPSEATQAALMVAQRPVPVVRGQCPTCGPAQRFVRGRRRRVAFSLYDLFEQHPVLAYTAITAAIAVPIIVINENNDDPARPAVPLP